MTLPADDRLRALAREILAQDQYARWRHQDVAVSWTQWLVAEVLRLQRWFAELAAASPVLFTCLLAAIGLVAAALLVHVGWTIMHSLRPAPAAASEPAAAAGPADTAVELAASGRFLDAARLLQIAVLQHLASRRLVTLSPAESNAVLTARLEAAPLPGDLAARTVRLVRGLERRWFRDRIEDEALYDAWMRLHGDLVAGVR